MQHLACVFARGVLRLLSLQHNAYTSATALLIPNTTCTASTPKLLVAQATASCTLLSPDRGAKAC